jgi:hypothetical protein
MGRSFVVTVRVIERRRIMSAAQHVGPLTTHTAAKNHLHAAKCKKDVSECVMCQMNVEWFNRLPLHVLSQVLAEPPGNHTRLTFGAAAIDRLIDRTTHDSERGKADVEANMRLFREYKDNGGKIY